jgi:hypothetical protein
MYETAKLIHILFFTRRKDIITIDRFFTTDGVAFQLKV